jgi:outer membrane protein assembly factor BamB/tetratricopeptide (TPR) repeat protein
VISEEVLRRALEQQKRAGRLLGEVLCEMGVTTEDEVESVVRSQIEEEIFELFQWKQARFEFLDGAAPSRTSLDGYVTSLTFDPNTLLMEAARRLDEWEIIKEKIGSLEEILILDEDAWEDYEFDELSAPERSILDLLDGERNIEDIASETSLPRFQICASLAMWLEQGKVRTLTTDELQALARESEGANNIPLAIKFYDQALTRDPDSTLFNEKLARCNELIGEARKAARFFERLGGLQWADGQQEIAVEAYEKAVALNPGSVAAHERLFEYAASAGNAAQVLSVGRALLRAYMKELKVAEAGDLCRGLLERFPEDIELRKAMINIHLDRRDAKAAAKEYEEILELLKPTNSWAEMAEVCSKIVQLDPERDDYRALIETYRSRAERSLKQILLKPKVLIPAMVAFVLVVGGLLTYNLIAQGRYARAQEAQQAGRLAAAHEGYKEVAEGYGWSFYGRAARQRMADIQRELDRIERDLRELVVEVDTRVREGRAAMAKQRLLAARLSFEAVIDRTSALRPNDPSHAGLLGMRDEAERQLAELTKTLDEFDKLIEEARQHARTGQRARCAAILEELAPYELPPELRSRMQSVRQQMVRLQTERSARELHELYVQARGRERDLQMVEATSLYERCVQEFTLDNLELRRAQDFLARREQEVQELQEDFGRLKQLRELEDWGGHNVELQRLLTQRPEVCSYPGWSGVLRFHIEIKGIPEGMKALVVGTVEGREVCRATIPEDSAIEMPACEPTPILLSLQAEGFSAEELTFTQTMALAAEATFELVKMAHRPAFPRPGRGEFEGGVAVHDGLVYAPNRNGNLYVFDRETGTITWAYQGHSARELAASPQLVPEAGLLLEGLLNGDRFLAIGRQGTTDQGEIRWEHAVSGHIKCRAAVVGDLVVVGCTDGSVYGLSLSGEERWRTEVNAAVEADIHTDGNDFFVATVAGHVFCLTAAGKERWRYPASGGVSSRMDSRNGVLYVGNVRGLLHAVDIRTGKRAWEQNRNLGRRIEVLGGVALLGSDTLIVASSKATQLASGVCFAIDTADGSDRVTPWGCTYDTLLSPPLVNEETGRIYLGTAFKGTRGGTVYALTLEEDGFEVRWYWKGDFPVQGQLALEDGLLHLATRGGQIVILQE